MDCVVEQFKEFEYRDGLLYRNGKECTSVSTQGYKQVYIRGKTYLQHRIIWLLHKGSWPNVIDHINGNKQDNRIENLRQCTQTENSYNQKGSTNSTSKFKGVSYDTATGKWRAQIMVNRKGIKLGRFSSEIDAARAYNTAALHHFGEFALLNEVS